MKNGNAGSNGDGLVVVRSPVIIPRGWIYRWEAWLCEDIGLQTERIFSVPLILPQANCRKPEYETNGDPKLRWADDGPYVAFGKVDAPDILALNSFVFVGQLDRVALPDDVDANNRNGQRIASWPKGTPSLQARQWCLMSEIEKLPPRARLLVITGNSLDVEERLARTPAVSEVRPRRRLSA